jgi:hypothetical protein
MRVKSIRSTHEVIFVRNGAKAYVKNPRVFLREKSGKRGFMKSSIVTPAQQVVAYPNYALFRKLRVKGYRGARISMFTFSHWEKK